ncbi:MAG TPA: DUF4388 domain-containing protein [Candidatus Eisenbacteria bacterium]|jgi:hypothetical protein
MALQGNLDDFSLPEILQLIAVQQKSGVLKLTAGADVAVIFFEAGRVVSTRDRRRHAKDPLKPFLVLTGRLTEAQLQQIETIETETRRELTDVLLSGNYVTSEDLQHALEEQIQDTLHQLLTWRTGSYHFSGDARTVPKFAVNVRLNTEGLLMESMRRMDEIARYKQTLSSPAMVLRPRALALPPNDLTPQEQRVLPLVDGLRPLRDILAQAKLVEFDVYEALHHLLDLGVIEISLSAAPPKVTPLVEEGPRVLQPEARPAGIHLGVLAVLVSLAIGIFVSPGLLARGERAAGVSRLSVLPELSVVDEASRLTVALEIYRIRYGSYPPGLDALAQARILSPAAVRHAGTRFTYHSDGTSYSRLPGAGTP